MLWAYDGKQIIKAGSHEKEKAKDLDWTHAVLVMSHIVNV